MSRVRLAKWAISLSAVIATLAIFCPAQTYNELLAFDGNTAAGPLARLTQGVDGSLYGTTTYGGTGTCNGIGIGCGVFFRITRNHSHRFQILYNFQTSGPVHPSGPLVLGNDGNFYGVMPAGIIFRMTPAGRFTSLYVQSGVSGFGLTSLTLGVDGSFYGVAYDGGAPSNSCPNGCGTIFRMTSGGVLTTLYSFCPQNYCPDGAGPIGALAQGADGNFYGTTNGGGLYKSGTFFKITPQGNFTLLYTFKAAVPSGNGLILASDGNFYGFDSDGFFQVTPGGALAQWGGVSGVPNPFIEGTDGKLYSTSINDGLTNNGFIFSVPLLGKSTDLYDFAGYPDDGSQPYGALVQSTDGAFYGTTYGGGSSPCNYGTYPGCGTIFSLDTGLPPFVTFIVQAARVGKTGGILGQGFTGTTSVSLNGVPASFTVVSDTLIKATIPPGATTGFVTVVTPTGTLTSNVPFHVIP